MIGRSPVGTFLSKILNWLSIVKKIELRNRIRTSYPHVQAQLRRAPAGRATATHRWQIEINGAQNAAEIQQINQWANSANILPHDIASDSTALNA
jgi:hypothetical protein